MSLLGRIPTTTTLWILSLFAAFPSWGASTMPLPSSHREAPGIAELPKCDATDFYMFNSYEAGRDDFVTIIANYQPFETPYGGPNFFSMDPDALYQIHIDTNADAREDLTFSFRFAVENRDISLNIGGVMVPQPLYNVGPVGPQPGNNSFLNVIETYTVDVVYGDQYFGRTFRITDAQTGDQVFKKPADNVGAKTFSDYEAYARGHIRQIRLPGYPIPGRVFVGQRKDPFVVNLGEIFDLVNTNPLGPENGSSDTLADDNVTSIILEIPKGFLARGGNVIGGWTTASLPQNRVLRTDPTFNQPTIESGAWIQVSRLAMPLVNEVVIGLRDKNRFNASRPRNDAQFATYVTNPTLPAILATLFNVPAPCLPRNDLVQVFLTGLPGLNQPAGVTGAEMMRLNMSHDEDNGGIAPTPSWRQNRLGALGGDLQGFPNGRRPGDDVVDIELRVVMGALIAGAGTPGSCAPVGNLPFTDGAFLDSSRFLPTFPYLTTPISSSPNH